MSGVKEELARRASNIKESDKKETQNSNSGTCRSDNEELSVRLLRADEIECRVSTINERGLSLLLYKDARVDQKILDETFTPFGWKRTHQIIDGNLYCTVEIWDAGKCQWIAKQDVGTTSYSEKEKGQASDSFKRACFNWVRIIPSPLNPCGDNCPHFFDSNPAFTGKTLKDMFFHNFCLLKYEYHPQMAAIL